jgi:hypothetical protein
VRYTPIPDDKKDLVASLVARGLTDEMIGVRLGTSGKKVHMFRKKHGIEKPKIAMVTKPADNITCTHEPIRIYSTAIDSYHDPKRKFEVKVYPPRLASGDLPLFEEGAEDDE